MIEDVCNAVLWNFKCSDSHGRARGMLQPPGLTGKGTPSADVTCTFAWSKEGQPWPMTQDVEMTQIKGVRESVFDG